MQRQHDNMVHAVLFTAQVASCNFRAAAHAQQIDKTGSAVRRLLPATLVRSTTSQPDAFVKSTQDPLTCRVRVPEYAVPIVLAKRGVLLHTSTAQLQAYMYGVKTHLVPCHVCGCQTRLLSLLQLLVAAAAAAGVHDCMTPRIAQLICRQAL